ncbi:BsaWI family type II restriction enzyme [Campylobacter upsaliensis]|uniref:BsaWI family type II restriction enzyme n=1 Tax=Campylobacter upsaliensis TaxID=28080 RepID=UPI002B3A039C|nr:BsaWI family type II restriction enzyme [Campylobacter upsaliensis]MEB2803639.1 BsaWI family type II restriction enzyme [Campylobacter upsaliensis]MEB2816791.1 BsaWI family type II restriction enzyme [Campylobacter upsaliensis]MEB2822861.1 BsaWI family type II restriction enzyme [Campylobacter upsaliensis]
MLNKNETKTLREIEGKYYMQPMLESIMQDLRNDKLDLKEVFNHLYEYLLNSKEAVEKLLKERVNQNEIKDISQARKSIAGSAFSNLIVWVFLKNKENGNIDKDIFITAKISQIPHFKDLFYIKVGEETQKPDVDLVIYRLDSKQNLASCLILSLKTSLRERAGQTYKWKLLMEIANTESSIKEKYNISYNPPIQPLVCFATVNFYNEINNPQYRGMFKFFDCAFIGKNIQTEAFIKPLSYMLDYIAEQL